MIKKTSLNIIEYHWVSFVRAVQDLIASSSDVSSHLNVEILKGTNVWWGFIEVSSHLKSCSQPRFWEGQFKGKVFLCVCGVGHWDKYRSATQWKDLLCALWDVLGHFAFNILFLSSLNVSVVRVITKSSFVLVPNLFFTRWTLYDQYLVCILIASVVKP